jgi:single-strand DNA-binding protein
VVWNGLAEFSAQYIKKGKPLFVEGYLKTRTWDNAEGVKMFRTEIVVDNVVLLGARDPSEVHIDHAEEALEESPVLEEESLPESVIV